MQLDQPPDVTEAAAEAEVGPADVRVDLTDQRSDPWLEGWLEVRVWSNLWPLRLGLGVCLEHLPGHWLAAPEQELLGRRVPPGRHDHQQRF